jgi:L-fucose isomerase-like protein
MLVGVISLRTGFVSFMAPAYTQDTVEVLKGIVSHTRDSLSSMGIKVMSEAGPVINLSDVEGAISRLRSREFDFVTALIPSWAEPPMIINTLLPFLQKPILLWALPSFQEGEALIAPAGAAGMSAVMHPLKVTGAKLKAVCGGTESDRVRGEIASFAHAAWAMNGLAHSRIGIFGYADMGSYTASFDQTSLRSKIGMEVEDYEIHRLLLRSDEVGDKEADDFILHQFKGWRIDEKIAKDDLKKAVKIYLALRKIVEERKFNAISMKCVYGMPTYYGITPCVPLALVGDQIPVVCESDVLGLATELIMDLVSEQRSIYLEFYDVFEDGVLMGVCGMIPQSALAQTPSLYKYAWGKLTGLMVVGPMRTGKITLARLASAGDRYAMHLTVGEAKRPRAWHEIGWQLEAPVYPSLEIALPDTKKFTDNILAQHYHLVYGDYTKELFDLCDMLDIEVVST